jgi:hypothetical protein
MSAEELGERLLGEVEEESLDKVGNDGLDLDQNGADLTQHNSYYVLYAI